MLGEVAHHPAGERIAGARRVDDAVGGIGGGACVDGLTGAGELYGGGAGSPDGAVIVRVTRII